MAVVSEPIIFFSLNVFQVCHKQHTCLNLHSSLCQSLQSINFSDLCTKSIHIDVFKSKTINFLGSLKLIQSIDLIELKFPII